MLWFRGSFEMDFLRFLGSRHLIELCAVREGVEQGSTGGQTGGQAK